MNEIQPSTQVRSLLDEFKSAGGVVGYILLDAGNLDPTAHDTHREAAIMTVKSINRQQNERCPLSLFALSIVEQRTQTMQGENIDPITFLGERWSTRRKCLLIERSTEDMRSSGLFCATDRPLPENAVSTEYQRTPADNDFVASGYAYAFSDPPYNLSLKPAQIQTLFDTINATLLPNLNAGPIQIYRWPTDWSNFFDAGHEWWGAFLWTVSQPGLPLVGIVASTTD